jgi:hypothetical protein
VLYWSANHEAYLSSRESMGDAGAALGERFERLDRGRGLAGLPTGLWLVLRVHGGKATLEFLRCQM